MSKIQADLFNGRQAPSGVYMAVRKTVYIGNIALTAYLLPKGEYVLSSNSITGAISKHRKNLGEFLESKSLEALPCKDWKLREIDSIPVAGRGTNIKPVPMHIAIAYWNYWNRRGNCHASALIEALSNGYILVLLDNAFEVQRSASEREQALTDMLYPHATADVQQVKAEMENYLRELEKQLTSVIWQKVSQNEQLTKINQNLDNHAKILTTENKNLAQQNANLAEEKEQLQEQVFVLTEQNKEKERGLELWYDKTRWAINMKQLADRKIEVLEKQVYELTNKLQATHRQLEICQETIIRNAQAMSEQILAEKQHKRSRKKLV
ncbi:MAG TPA: hypothetical protein V6D15_16125 [Oculatellaceae cyanobacterium]|jgi:predicted  nucleic acid-binding Zn-ribbon protein